MKNFFCSRDGASKGAALMIVLAFVVLLTGVSLAYFSRASTDRQLAHSSYNDS
jgi:Tfp pilus assembly protein PilX